MEQKPKKINLKNKSITVSFVTDDEMKKLNKKYLKRDFTTDVLSFNYDPSGELVGEVVVNVDQAKRQCKNYDNTEQTELAELVAHGVLHILGVHHPDDDEHTVHGVPAKK